MSPLPQLQHVEAGTRPMVGPVGPPAHCESETQFRYEESSGLWSLQANIEETHSLKKKEKNQFLSSRSLWYLKFMYSVNKIDSSKKEDQQQNFLCYL